MTHHPSSLKIALIGAEGKLGKEIARSIEKSTFFELKESYSRINPFHSETKADLIIDVSSAQAMKRHLEIAISCNLPIVIGTTGHEEEDLLKKAAEKIPVFYSSNFSLSMTLFQKMTFMLSKALMSIEKITIKETHHTQKKDQPSGSSKMLAKTIQSARKELPITIESFRVDHVIGTHDLTFFTPKETIELIHTATQRSIFAEGALLAAKFLYQKPKGFYGMQDLLPPNLLE